jgi:predicted DNA-binding protein
VKLKQISKTVPENVLVGTRVSPELKEQFQFVASANNRSVAGHLRHLIELAVEQTIEKPDAA